MTTAKLFKNGRSQAVRIPKEFRLPGKEVTIQRVGSSVLLSPQSHGWEMLFNACDELRRNGVHIERDQSPPEVRPPLWP